MFSRGLKLEYLLEMGWDCKFLGRPILGHFSVSNSKNWIFDTQALEAEIFINIRDIIFFNLR